MNEYPSSRTMHEEGEVTITVEAWDSLSDDSYHDIRTSYSMYAISNDFVMIDGAPIHAISIFEEHEISFYVNGLDYGELPSSVDDEITLYNRDEVYEGYIESAQVDKILGVNNQRYDIFERWDKYVL